MRVGTLEIEPQLARNLVETVERAQIRVVADPDGVMSRYRLYAEEVQYSGS